MSTLLAIAYPDAATAEKVRAELVQATKEKLVELQDAVVVEHQADGKIKLNQAVNTTATGAAGGAMWGGLIGLLFLAPLVGMAVGAASGAAAGAVTDTGVDDRFMKDLGAQLDSGGAALVLLIRDANIDKLLAEVKVPGKVIQSSLSTDSEQALRDALAGAGAA